ncbi:MAG: hypothetical protein KDC48_13085 [Planctomycetes bacterium]|nr:hypothetical protein [Planctomycetota bacterium]
MRTGPLLLIASLFAGFAAAQGDSRQRAKVLAQLAENDPRAVARATRDALAMPQHEVTQGLRTALQAWMKRDVEHAALARLFLLDALLARDEKLPADALLPCLDDPLTEPTTLALLCRDPLVNERLLFELFRDRYSPAKGCKENDVRRALLGNVLCNQRAPGFAAHLWDLAELDLHVNVVDGLPSAAHQRGVWLLPGFEPAPAPLDGFPPLPRSQLGMRLQGHDDEGKPVPFPVDPAVLVLIDTPTRIELLPAPDPSTQPAGFDYWGGGADNIARPPMWLATMSGLRENLFAMRYRHLDLTKGEPQQQVEKWRDGLREFKATLRGALVERGALSTEEAAACRDEVAIEYVDQRGDTSKPLPEALTKLARPAEVKK